MHAIAEYCESTSSRDTTETAPSCKNVSNNKQKPVRRKRHVSKVANELVRLLFPDTSSNRDQIRRRKRLSNILEETFDLLPFDPAASSTGTSFLKNLVDYLDLIEDLPNSKDLKQKFAEEERQRLAAQRAPLTRHEPLQDPVTQAESPFECTPLPQEDEEMPETIQVSSEEVICEDTSNSPLIEDRSPNESNHTDSDQNYDESANDPASLACDILFPNLHDDPFLESSVDAETEDSNEIDTEMDDNFINDFLHEAIYISSI